jgi:methionine-rich copper-binding protein CopC
VAFATLSILLAPGVASAHAELATMTPPDKSNGPAPTEIVATFTETLSQSGTSLAIVEAGGAVVAQGGTVDAGDKKTLRLAVPALVPGAYTVRWTSKSADDGDLDRGTTTFTVAAASPAPSAPASAAASPSPSAPAASAVPSAVDSPSSSASPSGAGTQASSTDAAIPIVVVLVALVLLGLWLLRGRGRGAA